MLKQGALRVGIPMAWSVITILLAVQFWPQVVRAYVASPILTVEAGVVWLVAGLAFWPLSRWTYTTGSVALMTLGLAFAAIVSGIDLTNKWTLMLGGGAFIGFVLAWLGGAGTHYWRFAQGKLPTDDDDT